MRRVRDRAGPRRRSAPALAVALALVLTAAACSDEPSAKDRSDRQDGTAAEPTSTTESPTVQLAASACERPSAVVAAPLRPVTAPDIVEASGVAMIPGTDGPVWVHNDSGDRGRVFAVDDAGGATSHDVPGAEAIDWEDMSAGPDGLLYVGDIGDNGAARASVTIFRFRPPDPAVDGPATEVARLTVTYADGPHNAEALMVDPVDEQLVIVTKGDGPAGVYTAPLAFENGGAATFERAGEVDTGGLPLLGQVTGGDISPDGSAILLRTYGAGLLYQRGSGQSLVEAFGSAAACQVPTGAEAQGEAIAFSGKGGGYVTIGEGPHPAIAAFAPPA